MMEPDQALNRVSLVVHSLRYLSNQLERVGLAALLNLLANDLDACLEALDSARNN
ncbi:hypothetical protein PSDVSF_32250 [Pseudodesulfovibrio sediminis]|uniref:Uncharacterized protein n=1 Tax=Pseudodesulfovibrio sediminis TaxID=2810563 RepID=A0ABM7PAC4_9BACT|nr:hypothetical protein PSDVSF_32250 [Pseudodesulfovibrio sediminis]